MEKTAFPGRNAPGVIYYKGPAWASGALCVLLALFCLALFPAAGRGSVDPSPVLLAALLLVCGWGALVSFRTQTAATQDCMYHRPALGRVKVIDLASLHGYSLSGHRYGTTVALLRGREPVARLAYSPELINYLNDRGLRACEHTGGLL